MPGRDPDRPPRRGGPIATTRTGTKGEALLKAGAAEVIVTDEENVVERVLELTRRRGAEFAFDAVDGPGVVDLAKVVTPEAPFWCTGL